MNLKHRKATIDDLPTIVAMIADDELASQRENPSNTIDERYIKAFHQIDADPNQYLIVVTLNDEIVGTCQLTYIPSLTYSGSTRMQIEAVRVAKSHRGERIGEWMIYQAIHLAKDNNAKIIQLTTNKTRDKAIHFYEKLGFEASHEGMKYYL